MMQHLEATRTWRCRRMGLGVSLVLLGLALAGLPNCHAQMRYSGGFIPTHHRSQEKTTPPPAPQTTAPKTPPSYFPDNDRAYPSFYPGVGPTRPPASPGVLLPSAVSLADLPWNQAGFVDYNEPPQVPQDSSLQQAKKYLLAAAPLPQASPAERPFAVLIAHLPEHGVLWVEGTRTRSTGRTRTFQSPPLLPSRKYNYRVRAAWIEDGHWVSQTRVVPVEAGAFQAVYLRPALLR